MDVSHIHWAHVLFNGIYYNNGFTEYRHTNGPVWWGKYDGHTQYQSVTDCSGWVNALLRQSYNLSARDMKKLFGKIRPYASTYYYNIINEQNFIKINKIQDAKIGDFIAILFPPGTSESDNTGHIMMINDISEKIDDGSWWIEILDQSSAHGTNDSRFDINGKKFTGLGIGYFRIYTDDQGIPNGYSWSTSKQSKYISIDYRPFAIGRLTL